MNNGTEVEIDTQRNAPPAFVRDGLRFVFFTVPQKVTESLDNLPAFKFEVENVTEGIGSVSWPLYVSVRIGDASQLEATEDRMYPGADTTPAERERCKECAKDMLAYIRKHFGKKVKVTLTEPAFTDFLDTDAKEEWDMVKLGEPSKLDFQLLALTEMVIWVFHSAQIAVGVTKDTKLTVAKTSDDSDYVKLNINGIGDWEFIARNGDTEKKETGYAVRGSALYMGRPVRFQMHSRIWQFTIHLDEVQQFMTPSLIEEVVNKAYRDIYEGSNLINPVMLTEVVIDPPWNRE